MHTTGDRAAAAPGRDAVFMGRDPELEELTQDLAGDSGRFVLVFGEGGIGKTTLLAEAAAAVPDDRTVLRASADAMNRHRSHGLLLEAFDPLLSDDDRRLAGRKNEHAIGEQLLSLVDATTVRPTVRAASRTRSRTRSFIVLMSPYAS